MTLVDTSAWVEMLRATESPTHRALRDLIAGADEIAITEPVVMELLAGARSTGAAAAIRARLLACEMLPVGGLETYESAAIVYQTCRSAGETPRRMMDCLIAAVAIRSDATLLHVDGDFEMIGRHTELSEISA